MVIVYLVNSVKITLTDLKQFSGKKDFQCERSFTQMCKYCSDFLCIFPVFHAIKSFMC